MLLVACCLLLVALTGCRQAPTMPEPTHVTLTPPGGQSSAVAAPSLAATKRIAVIGDSYTSGAGAQPWPQIVWDRLSEDDIDVEADVKGEGGSGYVTPGSNGGTTFAQRVATTVRPDDTMVVFFGSRNDRGVPADTLGEAVRSSFAEAKQIAPDARLLVIGPAWPTAPAPPEIEAVRNVVRDQAAAAGATFIDPLAEGWLVGDPALIQPDGIHPTDAGQVILADKLAPVIKGQLQQASPSAP
ncbi:SGNH/GDSL hydrolase family protein [Mycobacterium sp. LTG2003]